MIVAVSFLCNAIVDGIAYSFSPFLDTISSQFDAPKGKVAWIPSLLAGVYLSAGELIINRNRTASPGETYSVGPNSFNAI